MRTTTKRGAAIVASLLLATCAWGAWSAGLDEVRVTIDQVPEPVKQTILREAAGAKISEIERETKNGATVYEAEFQTKDGEVELRIAPDGSVLGRKVESKGGQESKITIEQVPAAARQALETLAKGAILKDVERERMNGAVAYEAAWSVNGTTFEATVAEDGGLLETEETIPVDKAPAAVRAASAKHFGANGKVIVEKKTIVLYEIEGKINGKNKELVVSAAGAVRGNAVGGRGDDDDDDDGDDDDGDDDNDDDDDDDNDDGDDD